MAIGGGLGCLTAVCVVAGFAAMILNCIFNVYYAIIFFIVGSAYVYRTLRKNQIQLTLDNDFSVSNLMGGASENEIYRPDHPKQRKNFDRYLRGGMEEQPDAFREGSNNLGEDETQMSFGEQENSSTGGSGAQNNQEKHPGKENWFFKRNKGITETQALY